MSNPGEWACYSEGGPRCRFYHSIDNTNCQHLAHTGLDIDFEIDCPYYEPDGGFGLFETKEIMEVDRDE